MPESAKTVGIVDRVFNGVKYAAYFAGAVFVLGVGYFAVTDSGAPSGPSGPATYKDADSSYAEAIIVVNNKVKKMLKSPSTAEFPLPVETPYRYLGGGRYEIGGYVDSQNGFGAIVRTEYTATVVKSGDGEFDFTVEKLNFQK